MNDCQKRGHRKLFITCEECHQVIDQATFLPPLSPKQQWISAKDRLPGDCECVLVWCKGMTPTSAYLIYKDKKPICYLVNDWDESDELIRVEHVTHWMPIPEPPK